MSSEYLQHFNTQSYEEITHFHLHQPCGQPSPQMETQDVWEGNKSWLREHFTEATEKMNFVMCPRKS